MLQFVIYSANISEYNVILDISLKIIHRFAKKNLHILCFLCIIVIIGNVCIDMQVIILCMKLQQNLQEEGILKCPTDYFKVLFTKCVMPLIV